MEQSFVNDMNTAGIAAPLLAWYNENRRILPWREDPTPYHVWLSEIMLQQTRVEAVRGYYERFLAALPDIRSLAEAPEEKYLKLWEGLGYYSRVRNLHRAAVQIMEEHGGEMPAEYEALLALPGIGPYTAAAIASIAFGLPEPAVDGNLLRVFARLTFCQDNILAPAAARSARAFYVSCMDAARSDAASHGSAGPGAFDPGTFDPGTFNQALMDLGALVCLPNSTPLCGRCPLATHCRAHALGREQEVPFRPAKAKRTVEKLTVFLIRHSDRILLHKRPATGLLAGLCEYPNAPGWLTRTEALTYMEGLGLEPLRIRKLPAAHHIFTHKEWHMHGYEVFTGDWGSTKGSDGRSQEAGGTDAISAGAPAAGSAEPGNTSLFLATTSEIEDIWSIPSAFRVYTDIVLGRR